MPIQQLSALTVVVTCMLQAAASSDEVVSVVPPADTPQRAHLPALQGQEPQPQPQEAQEEIVAHRRPPDRYANKFHSVLAVTSTESASIINIFFKVVTG